MNCSTSLRVLEFFKNVDKHRFYDFLKNAKVGRILTVWGAQPITTRPPVGRVRFVRWTRNGHGFLKNSKVGRIFIRSVSVGRVRFVRFVRWTRNGHGFLHVRSVSNGQNGHGRPT